MTKKLLTVAVLSLVSSGVMADTSLYGTLDISVSTVTNAGQESVSSFEAYANWITNYNNPVGTINGMTDGVWLPSVWGITGKEDLGNGMNARFKLESNLQTNNGISGNGGQLFDRFATMGIDGSWGSIDAGNMMDPLFLESFMNGVRQAHSASLAVNGQIAYGAPCITAFAGVNPTVTASGVDCTSNQILGTRMNNMVTYKTPVLYNNTTTIQVGYQFGNTAGDNTINSSYHAMVDYKQNGLDVNAGYEELNGYWQLDTTPIYGEKLKKWVIGANYTHDHWKFAGQINSFIDSYAFPNYAWTHLIYAQGYELGVAYKFSSALTAALNYVWVNDNSSVGREAENNMANIPANPRPNVISVSLKYDLSKRTSIWGLVSRADADGSYGGPAGWDAIYGQNASFANTTGSQQTAISLGMTHTF